MASYNAGRSFARILTDGAFETLERDSAGYVTVAVAAEQLLTRRRWDQGEGGCGGGREQDTEMRAFVERTVAAFSRSRPGYLNRKEFARMYETFIKRPSEFVRLMAAGEDVADLEGDEAEEPDAAKVEADARAPHMSKEQLRSMVEEVNRRLATEDAQTAVTAPASVFMSAAPAEKRKPSVCHAVDDLQLD